MPVLVSLCVQPEGVESVLALRRADKDSPSLTVAKGGPDDLGPYSGVHISKFVKHGTVKVNAPEPVGIVCPVNPDPRAVVREFDPKLRRIDLPPRPKAVGVFKQVCPGDV